MTKEDFAVKHGLVEMGLQEARARGQKYYIGTRPCKYDHDHWRTTDNRCCVQCTNYRNTDNRMRRQFGPSTTAISKSDAIHDELRLKRLLREMEL